MGLVPWGWYRGAGIVGLVPRLYHDSNQSELNGKKACLNSGSVNLLQESISSRFNFTATGTHICGLPTRLCNCIPELSSFDRAMGEGLVLTGVPIFFPALANRCLAFAMAETTLWEW